MASVERNRESPVLQSAAVVLGLTLAFALLADPLRAARGGLASWTIAALVAGAGGVRWALLERRPEPRGGAVPTRWSAGAGRMAPVLARMLALGSVGAASAAVLGPVSWRVGLAALVVWGGTAAAVEASGRRAVSRVAMVAAGTAAVAVLLGPVGAVGGLGAPPWSLLEPHWETWDQWMPTGVVLGFLLAGPGLGLWRVQPPPPPGAPPVPWLTAGVGLLAGLGATVALGAAVEAQGVLPESAVLAMVSDAPGLRALGGLACATAAAVCLLDAPERTLRVRHAAGGWLATVWFVSLGLASVPLWWRVVLPIGLAVVAAASAVAAPGTDRSTRGVLGGASLLLLVCAWAGIPSELSAEAAGAGAFSAVAVVWIVGTSVLRSTGGRR